MCWGEWLRPEYDPVGVSARIDLLPCPGDKAVVRAGGSASGAISVVMCEQFDSLQPARLRGQLGRRKGPHVVRPLLMNDRG